MRESGGREPERTITPAGLRAFLVDDGEEDSTGHLQVPGLLTYVEGGAGDDVLRGGCRSEAFSDGAGGDTVRGGAGADVLLPEVDGAPDAFDGEAGLDAVSYRATEVGTAPLTIDLGGPDRAGRRARHRGRGRHRRGSGRARLIGAAGNEALLGRGGDDHVDGGPRADFLSCGDGADTARATPEDLVDPDCERREP